MNDEIKNWCPTRSGTYTAYEPQWFDGTEWKRIPTATVNDLSGIPYPLMCGGITLELGLFGYEQAQTLAWAAAATMAAQGKTIQVRAQEFEVHYELKARAVEEDKS